MLRTSLRTDIEHLYQTDQSFLSSNAQDFIEDGPSIMWRISYTEFLSSNAQDFIEERC